jgi:hypothetical protein
MNIAEAGSTDTPVHAESRSVCAARRDTQPKDKRREKNGKRTNTEDAEIGAQSSQRQQSRRTITEITIMELFERI